MTQSAPWEQGSEFAWFGESFRDRRAGEADQRQRMLTGSGRDALRAVLRLGAARHKWRRVLVPAFLCQEVVESISREHFEVTAYEDDPRLPVAALDGEPWDVVLVVNTFGVRRQPGAACRRAFLIEDHTHDPWSAWARDSRADYCVASLRKTLPIPDGGLVWSPAGHELPAALPLTTGHRLAAANKLEAMLLKGLYLAGHPIEKSQFRALACEGEQQIAAGEPSGIGPLSEAILGFMDLERWREARKGNYLHLASLLTRVPQVRVLELQDPEAYPFSMVLVFDTPLLRNALRDFLIARRVYPAVLWPLDAARIALPASSVDLSRRVLSLHCDGRYGVDDMTQVAELVRDGLTRLR